jgi:hypothetical protein
MGVNPSGTGECILHTPLTPGKQGLFRQKVAGKSSFGKGLSRESLYKALSGERSPGFDTILKVINVLGFKIHAEPAGA